MLLTRIKRHLFGKSLRLGMLSFVLVSLSCFTAEAQSKPNVVFILADDLGWSDTTLYGTTSFYKTPNIERLAGRGMTFTHAYSASPLCSPTRASVLTGLSPARHGITSPICHLPKATLTATYNSTGPANQKCTIPNSASRLNTDYYTLAEMFRDNGYATGHFGKWHLGPEPYSPLEHGFDVDLPHHSGPGPAGSYVAPWKFKDFDHDPDIPNEHIEDRMAKEAVAFMESNSDKPFFLNYWMFSVHAPFDAKQSLIDTYREQVDSNNPQRCPTYAAMIESMDDAVGTILNTLDRLGIADHTIVVFASDNGGNMYSQVDSTSATSNFPLRGGKATMYEGGVRGPAIVVDPGHVQAGTRSAEVIQSCDFYPTLLERLAIAPQPNQSFDGISLIPALRGEALDRLAIFTYFPHSPNIPDWLPPSVSVHAGEWKLIRIFHGGDDGQHAYRLFNLEDDLGENVDLASIQPERVRELDQMIDEFLDNTDAIAPLPNPKFDPGKYRPEMIGNAHLKATGNTDKKAKRKARNQQSLKPQEPIAGWLPGGTCQLAMKDGSLDITSGGGDPYISYKLPSAVTDNKLVLKFRMSSNARGAGHVFWQERGLSPAFNRERCTQFDVAHDGTPHEYNVEWAVDNAVLAVRIDPATGPGRISLTNIRLTTGDGQEVYRWKL
ncbi:sulfatase [Rubripirellula amarantea]